MNGNVLLAIAWYQWQLQQRKGLIIIQGCFAICVSSSKYVFLHLNQHINWASDQCIYLWEKLKYSLILGLVPCIVFEGEDGVIPEKIQLVAKKTKNETSLESFPRKQIEKMRNRENKKWDLTQKFSGRGRTAGDPPLLAPPDVKLMTNNNLWVAGGAGKRFSGKSKGCKFSAERHWGGALREVLMQLGHACAQLPYCWWYPRIELLMLSNFCFWTNFSLGSSDKSQVVYFNRICLSQSSDLKTDNW